MQYYVVSILQKIWLVLLAGLIVYGFLNAFVNEPIKLRELTSHKYHLWRGKKFLYLGALVILVFSVAVNCLAIPLSCSAMISMNYDGASRGLNPNSTRFNQADMLSDEVLDRVIELGKFKDVNPEDLKDAIDIIPVEKASSSDDSYRVSTEYEARYTANRKLSQEDGEDVLQLFCGCYKEWFIDQYSYNVDSLDADFETVNREDYLDMCDYFDKTADLIHDFMSSMARKETTFESSSSGDSFQTIGTKADNVKTSLVQDLRAYLLDAGIAKDTTTYMGRLTIENVFLSFDAQKHQRSNVNRLAAIKRYEDDMARIVLVPTYDMDGQFLMSQTKIGIDSFAEGAEDYAARKTSVDATIANNNYIFRQLGQGGFTDAAVAKADAMVASIEAELTDIAADAKAAVKEFDEKQANGYLSVAIATKESRIRDAIEKSLVETLAVLIASLFAICVADIKKERNRRG